MDRKHNAALTPNAKALRKNMTPQECHLWHDFLKNYPVRFLRQKVITSYIVDFYCAKAKLVIELDGSQHYTDDGAEYDAVRTKVLEQFGLQVIRYSNFDIGDNFNGVCEDIDRIVRSRIPLSPAGDIPRLAQCRVKGTAGDFRRLPPKASLVKGKGTLEAPS